MITASGLKGIMAMMPAFTTKDAGRPEALMRWNCRAPSIESSAAAAPMSSRLAQEAARKTLSSMVLGLGFRV